MNAPLTRFLIAVGCMLVVLVGCSSAQDTAQRAPVDEPSTAATTNDATATPNQPTEPAPPEPAPTEAEPEPTATPSPSPTPIPPPDPSPTPTAEPTPRPTSTPSPTPTPTPVIEQEPLFDLQGELQFSTNELNEMIRFVEQETGRGFLYPPRFEVATEFDTTLGIEPAPADQQAAIRERLTLQLRRYQALGLTEQSVSEAIENWVGAFESGGFVAGVFYPTQDLIELPPQTASSTIVHELVHALDHQHTDLTRTDIANQAAATGNYEQVVARGFVIEGRASHVEGAWLQANPIDLQFPEVDGGSLLVPEPLLVNFFLAYSQGQTFIDSRGGAGETWDLLTDPPPATEQLFLPDVTDEPIVDVAFPPADGPILEQRAFGAVDMVLWPVQDGNRAAIARFWGGGASTMWGDDTETCMRVALAGDNPQDLARLTAIYGEWAEGDDARTTSVVEDRLVITSCAPYVP